MGPRAISSWLRYYPTPGARVNALPGEGVRVSAILWRHHYRGGREDDMIVEEKLKGMGFTVPNLEDLYRTNASGAHYISHFAVQGMLFLSGTVPIKDGKPYLPGVVGENLTIEQGYDAARYAALTTLAAVKYALGDLDRVQQIVHMTGFVNSAPGFNDQPRVING